MIQGSIVALVTPMTETGAIDEASLDRLVEFHIEQGTDAIVAVGTTGESATLDEKEHCHVIGLVVEKVGGRIPVIAGTGANSTTEAIRLTREAKVLGADACLLVTPYYNKPTQEGLYQHYKTVAEAVGIPQILYNVPGRTACDMLPETVGRLAKIKNITGIKEATGDLKRIPQIKELCGDDFPIYSGDDGTACEACLLGAVGDISVTANIAPGLMHEMCAAAINGDREKAITLNKKLRRLHENLFLESNPIPVKWAVGELGLIKQGIRLPMTWFSPKYHDELRSAMQEAGVI
ncbi:MAG: 4-hydroxy-tetrahydrodipicolinate synthase [Methylococcales bacterium]